MNVLLPVVDGKQVDDLRGRCHRPPPKSSAGALPIPMGCAPLALLALLMAFLPGSLSVHGGAATATRPKP